MKLIPLSQKKKYKLYSKKLFAQVSDKDFNSLNKFYWQAEKSSANKTYYASRRTNDTREKKYMHREILRLKREDKRQGEHKNRNGLDCRRANLRIATISENNQNRKSHKGSSSKYLGVSWCEEKKKWKGTITLNGKNTHLGFFLIEKQAAKAYNKSAKQNFKEFANINRL